MCDLGSLARFLGSHPGVAEKASSRHAFGHALEVSGNGRLGDDCAAIVNPAGTGHLLFAAEGMSESLVAEDPWFAGYSAVMMNLSDVAAMGGRAVAITDVLWAPAEEISANVWLGMQAAARAYQVPIVGGHTTRNPSGRAMLGAAVLGHAGERLITSFDIRAGDQLLIAIDMHGEFRGRFWDASTDTASDRLRSDLELLPSLAEKGLCRAGKDIGNGGIAGALAMLCKCSEVGAVLELENLPCPMEAEMEHWLVTIPSYGYLLAVAPDDVESTLSHFTATKITCRPIGRFTEGRGITITADNQSAAIVFGKPGVDSAGDVFDACESPV